MNTTRALLAEKAAIIERHLTRVASKLPIDPKELSPQSDASDAVILHRWQAVQLPSSWQLLPAFARGWEPL